jgi:hypothetical protein
MTAAIRLDHVGIVGRSLDTVATLYEQLGFTLTPRVPTAGGRIVNRCAMLGQGYLELMALAPGGASATLERFLARREGAHIIALSVDDMASTDARLQLAGFESTSVEQSERAVDTETNGPLARFVHLPIPELPEARINLIRHVTPELLWQPRFLAHANHAVALAEVTLAIAAPAVTAARFSRLSGCVVVPDPAGGFALGLSRGSVRLLPPDAFPPPAPAPPSIVSVTLHTDDGNAAIAQIMHKISLPHRIDDHCLTVRPDAAGGLALQFRA